MKVGVATSVCGSTLFRRFAQLGHTASLFLLGLRGNQERRLSPSWGRQSALGQERRFPRPSEYHWVRILTANQWQSASAEKPKNRVFHPAFRTMIDGSKSSVLLLSPGVGSNLPALRS